MNREGGGGFGNRTGTDSEAPVFSYRVLSMISIWTFIFVQFLKEIFVLSSTDEILASRMIAQERGLKMVEMEKPKKKLKILKE